MISILFFFSSRRRHTRWPRDWSSDVCSSDLPLENSNPFSGEHNQLSVFEEIKLEVIVPEEKVNKAINKMINAHPYEEVAYDIYKLENVNKTIGIVLIGQLS